MGHDSVREDFLAGKNRAVKLTETELQYLDELFVEVSPKRDPEENQPSFLVSCKIIIIVLWKD